MERKGIDFVYLMMAIGERGVECRKRRGRIRKDGQDWRCLVLGRRNVVREERVRMIFFKK